MRAAPSVDERARPLEQRRGRERAAVNNHQIDVRRLGDILERISSEEHDIGFEPRRKRAGAVPDVELLRRSASTRIISATGGLS